MRGFRAFMSSISCFISGRVSGIGRGSFVGFVGASAAGAGTTQTTSASAGGNQVTDHEKVSLCSRVNCTSRPTRNGW